MNEVLNPKAAHQPLGAYSHTVKVPKDAEWLVIAGQVGINAKGQLQAGIRRQAEQVFRNVVACLRAHRMGKEALVKLNVYLTDARNIEAYREARRQVLGDETVPASTLVIVDGLAQPEMLIEVEGWAAQS